MTETVIAPKTDPDSAGWARRFRLPKRRSDPAGSPNGGGNGSGGPGEAEPTGKGDNRIDLRNTWQIVAGSLLIPLGVVLILIAWYGAAHTRFVQQQIPYLVSGSFAGLGCMILGGLLYWAHWLYRMYDQADQHHEEHLKAIEQQTRAIVEHLSPGSAGMRPSASSGSGVGSLPPPPSGAGTGYVATAAGTVYHVPGCAIVAHHTEGLRRLGPNDLAGMEPCRICTT